MQPSSLADIRDGVRPERLRSGKKTNPARKASKAPSKATSAKGEGARKGSKTAKVLALLKRRGGATMKELRKATGWLPHSVRGFISGADPATFCTPLLHG
jgi:hypothetical protein